MVPPLFVRPLTPDEHQAIRAGPRSPSAFTLRRCRILAASAEGLKPSQIAPRCGRPSQTARNALRAFAAEGTDCLREKSHRPASARPGIDDAGCERPRALLHRSPRDFGEPTSLWTPEPAAGAAFAEGLTARLVSGEAIRQALERLGVGWRRAEDWITSPGPSYLRKERA
ncbi:helix-turn-helix domain-containing protein [Tautonia plasticadhaerens]|uniref:Winged helix-turn helix domain-containing protein n=1 Tax=Tautonia plasticadhaerens TaxID=2527974 RepID=A0A518H834_9BACT|nr:helix-turn-helix domain-containing protein [Tautonia plasticadhaerens]QDV37003.1 hypothetical protein ElP_49350 [Tautonia plasticadhaerens]QDV37658.1 hypothetical protein ElP_56000 [Tautonia plasticadhaerens]QDV37660.1 hypothetical protein ElP_56020 [Tautonia plasticadhaerens]QDV39510.1 hypothetical protein ElP_74780 [Tautonia plasticadhaerens]